MILNRTIAPTGLPVTAERMRARCGILHGEFDVLLGEMIAAATDYLDGPTGILGRAICTQTWRMEFAAWPGEIIVPVDPIKKVTVECFSVSAGDWGEAPEGAYTLAAGVGSSPRLTRNTGLLLPDLGALPYPVRIDVEAGFGEPEEVPPAIKAVIGMLVDHWFRHRGVVVVGNVSAEIEMTVSPLLARWRRHL